MPFYTQTQNLLMKILSNVFTTFTYTLFYPFWNPYKILFYFILKVRQLFIYLFFSTLTQICLFSLCDTETETYLMIFKASEV